MKKLLLISVLIISTRAYSQLDWPNYSTSIDNAQGTPSIGVAIPYNGNYHNFDKNVVGISHWNPGSKLGIDTALNAQTPLFFVYDTAGVYFLLPGVNEKNARDYEFTVLLDNKSVITPWGPVNRFTEQSIGSMKAGSGISGNYRAGTGQYLVAQLRNKAGQVISSRVVYFKKKAPAIALLSTSDNARAFTSLIKNEDHFSDNRQDLGWHRQYTSSLAGDSARLQLAHNENNILVQIDAKIYRKEALEYALYKGNTEIRQWAGNERANNYILLENLAPGNYRLLTRFTRQPESITELRFSLAPAWYNTAGFYAATLAFLAVAAAGWYFLAKYRKQKQASALAHKKAEQSTEALQNIHALLNPHFTFNALSSIQGLVMKGQVDAASTYLSSFGALLRETLKESKSDHIPLTKELENLQLYIGLEQLRYHFVYDLAVDADIDLFTTVIPPFLLQPFVENAIKHGFSKMNGEGVLTINILKQENDMLVKITDNGPGFDTAALQEGYGLSLSRKRISLQNREYGEELTGLQLDSTNKGATVIISFKNWL
ncbi:histidine kinase [Chitinophaga sp.]|uniref:sensor histidine kinase n=1 Tax=Chitinophaga sp. TaxID=1869181 RepID=UPI0031D570D9